MDRKPNALLSAMGVLLAACALPASAQTYTSTSAPAPIADSNPSVFTTMTVSVPDSFIVNSLSVTVGFSHTYTADIANMALVAPTGEIITLALPTGTGVGGDNFKNTTFDDRATLEIPTTTADAPYRKRYRASTTLGAGQISLTAAQGAGLQANGTWTLRCNDDASGDVGTIDYVILSLNERVFVGSEVAATPNLSNNAAVPPGPNPATPGAAAQSQTGLTIAIPDGDTVTGASSTLLVAAADAQFISGVDVSFSVTHPELSDLRVRLTHPNGTTSVDVVIPGAMTGSAATPNTDAASTPVGVNRPYVTTLADGAGALSGGAAPYRGKFAPSNALTAFNGLTSNGTWTLTVLDEVAGVNTGSIREWSLHVRGAAASPMGVGSAVPTPVVQGNMTTLSVVVTPAIALTGVTSVTVDASTLTGNGGDTAVALTQVGMTSTWSGAFTASGTVGAKAIPFTITETGAVGTGTGSIAVSITPAPPANPTCATATPIVVPFSSGAINIGGSPDDPSINPSCDGASNTGATNPVWFTLTPASTGVYLFFKTASSPDTVLSVWTGTCPSPLTQFFCTDSGHESSPGQLLLLTGGTTYYAAISRFGAANVNADTVTLNVTFIPAPANDECSAATVVTAPTNLTSTNIDARGALSDVGLTCNSAGFTSATTAGVWFKAEVPALSADDYILTYTETAGTDTIWGVFTGSCGTLTQAFCNGTDSGNAFLIRAGETYYFLLGRAGSAAQPTSVTSYTTAFTWAAATSACCNSTLNTCSVISKSACAAQTPPGAWRGPTNVACTPVATFAAIACGAAPANDLCPSAMAIVGSLPQSLQVNAAAAATDDLDASCNSTTQGGGTPPFVTRFGVWYSYATGADAGTLSLSELTSNDAIVQVFTGSCGSLTPVGCLGGAALNSVAGTTIALNANTTHYLLLGMNGNNSTPSGAAPQYNLTVNSFTAATGACCTGTTCSVGVTASGCTGLWLGANSVCNPPQASESPNLAVPDFTSATNTIGVLERSLTVAGEAGPITSITVTINYAHTWAGDNQITLIAPDNTTAPLIIRPGAPVGSCDFPGATPGAGSLNDFNGTYVISDAGSLTWAAAVVAGPSPLAGGTFKASGCTDSAVSLNATFAAVDPNGTWKLRIQDHGAGDTGTLRSWNITINSGAAPCAGVGACCTGGSCSTVLNAAACSGGTFQGVNSSCSPDPCMSSTDNCCRGTTCNPVAAGACTGTIAGSNSLVVTSCGGGNTFASCCYADFNHDGTQSIDDLFLYINAYFGTCS